MIECPSDIIQVCITPSSCITCRVTYKPIIYMWLYHFLKYTNKIYKDKLFSQTDYSHKQLHYFTASSTLLWLMAVTLSLPTVLLSYWLRDLSINIIANKSRHVNT